VSIIEKAVSRLEATEKTASVPIPKPDVPPHSAQGVPISDATMQGAGQPETHLHEVTVAHVASAEAQSTEVRAAESTTIYGEIDLERLRLAGMITPEGSKTQVSEEFRIIKRPLLTNAFGRGNAPIKHGNLVMVTSSFPGEGKSFSAINLAMSIAMEMDHTVLLVDADVARPSLPASLGIQDGPGLMDLLLDDNLRVSDVLIRTNVPKLHLLPAGRSHPRATELLASDAMSRLLAEMSTRYSDRLIIFDSPPLLATTESRVLATRMGQVVMVVEAAKTPQDAVKEALAQLDKSMVVGLLLNKGTGGLGDDQYAYAPYGYSYGA
jgi:protein-tyrosine kinase